jgi:DoxX-like family
MVTRRKRHFVVSGEGRRITMFFFQVSVALAELALLTGIAALLIRVWRHGQPSEPSRQRLPWGNALIYLSAAVFIASGISKLAHYPPAVTEMGLLRLTGGRYLLVAGIELTSGVLVLIPQLRSLALLFISAHVGGAICAHLIAGQYFAMLPSLVVLTMCWFGMFLRHPQILWSLDRSAQPSTANRLLDMPRQSAGLR